MWQLSTVQFDWNLPERFDLGFKGEDGELHRPVMVHRALFGSVERFFGVLIEHYAGSFPFWLGSGAGWAGADLREAPGVCANVKARLAAAGVRVELDERNEKMNAKIREFGVQKVPFILIMGDKEAGADEVSVRTRGKGDQGGMGVAAFLERCAALDAAKGVEL